MQIEEGQRVSHQFEHGNSFGRQAFTTGMVVRIETRQTWRPGYVVELDAPAEGMTQVKCFAGDLQVIA